MTQGKRQLQKETTREKIIQTTMRLYLEKGISTTTDEIAKESGLSHGAIFVHFPSRDDLRIHVLARFTQKLGDKMHALSVSSDKLQSILLAHLNGLEEYEHFYTELISNVSNLPEDARDMIISLQSILSHHFSLAIEQGQREGEIKEIPLHIMFNTWLGLVHYYLLNADLFAPGESVLKRHKNELVDNFILLISR